MKKIDGCVGRSDGVFDVQMSVISDSRKVVIRKIDNCTNRVLSGGIIVPESSEMNNRLAKGVITACSDTATTEYGIVVGDTVLCDRLAVYYDTNPVCVMDYENVICKLNDEDGSPIPLKNMVLTKEIKRKEISNVGGIYLPSTNPLDVPIGIVIESSSKDISKGDYISLSTGADIVTVKEIKYRIYKADMVLAKIELTEEEIKEYDI